MTATTTTFRVDRASMQWLADWLAVGVALALRWSTSLASIFIVAWLLAVVATFEIAPFKRELMTLAGTRFCCGVSA
jgi:dolichyl-phosphate-mannose--protein O-mannosyl transferase